MEMFGEKVEVLITVNQGIPTIKMIGKEDGMPFATATVNVPGVLLGKNEAVIKNYSENQGILEMLVEEGVVKPTGRLVKVGMTSCPVVKVDVNYNR